MTSQKLHTYIGQEVIVQRAAAKPRRGILRQSRGQYSVDSIYWFEQGDVATILEIEPASVVIKNRAGKVMHKQESPGGIYIHVHE